MNRLVCVKPLLAVVATFAALTAASTAHARSDLFFSIGVHGPAPVYVQPAPVYVQPQPIYGHPRPVYVQPQPAYGHGYQRGHRGPWGDRDHDGVPNIYDHGSRHHDGREGYRAGPRGDIDRDGVPNRYDRAPGNPYRY